MNTRLLIQIQKAHRHYQALTGAKLPMAPHRERLWYEWIKAGYQTNDLNQVIEYLKQQIRQQRRNVGALKLSNLLDLDRFEEDLAISRINLRPAPERTKHTAPPPVLPLKLRDAGNQRAMDFLRTLKREL